VRLASLYSGGKDSSFSLYLAEQSGHDVPYVVNIRAENNGSWIFHTPNQNAVPVLAELMGKRLVQGITNGSEDDDMAALRRTLEGLDIDGVVTGAVHSDYQWDRMNIVCGDLGLKVVSPLWRKDQDMILNEMMDSGINAMIIGVYAEGFDESWLGRIIDRNTFKELKELNRKYGISVMGEGGEYESLTIDSPMQKRPLTIVSEKKEWRNMAGTMDVQVK